MKRVTHFGVLLCLGSFAGAQSRLSLDIIDGVRSDAAVYERPMGGHLKLTGVWADVVKDRSNRVSFRSGELEARVEVASRWSAKVGVKVDELGADLGRSTVGLHGPRRALDIEVEHRGRDAIALVASTSSERRAGVLANAQSLFPYFTDSSSLRATNRVTAVGLRVETRRDERFVWMQALSIFSSGAFSLSDGGESIDLCFSARGFSVQGGAEIGSKRHRWGVSFGASREAGRDHIYRRSIGSIGETAFDMESADWKLYRQFISSRSTTMLWLGSTQSSWQLRARVPNSDDLGIDIPSGSRVVALAGVSHIRSGIGLIHETISSPSWRYELALYRAPTAGVGEARVTQFLNAVSYRSAFDWRGSSLVHIAVSNERPVGSSHVGWRLSQLIPLRGKVGGIGQRGTSSARGGTQLSVWLRIPI